jgi:hypothetical protein
VRVLRDEELGGVDRDARVSLRAIAQGLPWLLALAREGRGRVPGSGLQAVGVPAEDRGAQVIVAVCVLGLAVLMLCWMVVVVSNQADELQMRIGALERVAVFQQRYNDQIDRDITRIDERTLKEMSR